MSEISSDEKRDSALVFAAADGDARKEDIIIIITTNIDDGDYRMKIKHNQNPFCICRKYL